MITDRTEQTERPAATRPHPFAERHILRRRHALAAPTSRQAPAQDPRASVASAFRVLARGAEPDAAQGRAATFYRSSGQDWARSLGGRGEPASRAHVAAAFRAMAHGVAPEAACAAMLRFYRSSDHDWARGLGGIA